MRDGESANSSPRPTLLLVEDDPAIERTLRRPIEEWGYHLVWASTVAEARALIAEAQPDLIILDLVLPDGDGLLLTSSLSKLTNTPILICSARNRQVDRVLGLKMGASDFVGKPFDLDELEARIEAVMRRAPSTARRPVSNTNEIRVGDLVITPRHASVRIVDQPVHLTPIEYRLLTVLASEPESIFDRQSLTKRVWGYDDLSCDHLVDVHVGRLRAKLRSVNATPKYLVTVRGRGFRLLGETKS
ncbi:MAG: response regulator transcription factor [Chloroflexi bacterium]|nr:response regulator transcription factor [Chloroflexota bacterium]